MDVQDLKVILVKTVKMGGQVITDAMDMTVGMVKTVKMVEMAILVKMVEMAILVVTEKTVKMVRLVLLVRPAPLVLPDIAAALASGGMPAETPVAVVTDATTPRQRVLVSTLDRTVQDVEREGLGSPAIIAIGSIVRLRAMLAPLSIVLEAAQ